MIEIPNNPKVIVTPDEIEQAKIFVRRIFKNEKGGPFEMTTGQAIIFVLITKRKYPRLHIETHTRYGKSEIISIAVLTRRVHYAGKTSIVAGNKDKAGIIMKYAIGHIFDHPLLQSAFVLEKGENEENIRRYRNKDRINFKIEGGTLGEIFISTAANAMGFGAEEVIEDESALIPDTDHALVMRMIESQKDENGNQIEGFLCKVGNPWESEHFSKSYKDPNYYKVVIDYVQGIKEGRVTPAHIDEMRKQPFFDVLYECRFPKQGTVDEKGWIPLLTRDQVINALVKESTGFGINKIGCDVAGGGRNFSVIVQRHTNMAQVALKNQDPDTMNFAEAIINKKTAEGIWPEDISIDKVGVGKGAYDILNRNKETAGVYGINGADKPTTPQDEGRFINLRAELFWKAREWILGGGKLLEEGDFETSEWLELAKIKYKTKLEGTKGKMQIMPKDLMLKEGLQSPDIADGLSMTFRTLDVVHLDKEEQEILEAKEDQGINPFDPFR